MIDNDNVYDRFMVRIKKVAPFAVIGIILSLIALLTPTVDLIKGFLNKENIEEGLRSQLVIAQTYYSNHEYEKCLQLYVELSLHESPIAYNNLGYLYSMGLGVQKDPRQAREYYNKAAERGCKLAFNNLAACHLHNPSSFEELIVALKNAFMVGNNGVDMFVANCCKNSNLFRGEPYSDTHTIAREFFSSMTEEQQIEVIKESMDWCYPRLIVSKTILTSTDFYRYISTGICVIDPGEASYIAYESKEYKLQSRFASCIKEEFDYLGD